MSSIASIVGGTLSNLYTGYGVTALSRNSKLFGFNYNQTDRTYSLVSSLSLLFKSAVVSKLLSESSLPYVATLSQKATPLLGNFQAVLFGLSVGFTIACSSAEQQSAGPIKTLKAFVDKAVHFTSRAITVTFIAHTLAQIIFKRDFKAFAYLVPYAVDGILKGRILPKMGEKILKWIHESFLDISNWGFPSPNFIMQFVFTYLSVDKGFELLTGYQKYEDTLVEFYLNGLRELHSEWQKAKKVALDGPQATRFAEIVDNVSSGIPDVVPGNLAILRELHAFNPDKFNPFLKNLPDRLEKFIEISAQLKTLTEDETEALRQAILQGEAYKEKLKESIGNLYASAGISSKISLVDLEEIFPFLGDTPEECRANREQVFYFNFVARISHQKKFKIKIHTQSLDELKEIAAPYMEGTDRATLESSLRKFDVLTAADLKRITENDNFDVIKRGYVIQGIQNGIGLLSAIYMGLQSSLDANKVFKPYEFIQTNKEVNLLLELLPKDVISDSSIKTLQERATQFIKKVRSNPRSLFQFD